MFQLGEGEQQDGFKRTVLAMMETHTAEATKEAKVGSLLLHLLYHQSSAKASAASSKASAVSSGHPSSAASSSSSSSSDHANEALKARERSPDLVEEEVDLGLRESAEPRSSDESSPDRQAVGWFDEIWFGRSKLILFN